MFNIKHLGSDQKGTLSRQTSGGKPSSDSFEAGHRTEHNTLKVNRLNHTAGSDQSGLDDTLVDSNPFSLALNPGDDSI